MNFGVLFQKEIAEHVKTYKLLIVAAVFLLFGLSTPMLFKFLPEIVKLSGEQIPIQMPTFTAADAVKSYINSLGQIGLLVTVLVAMGSVAQERERGTAVMTLCKPVGFGAFVSAKLAALVLIFGIGVALGAIGFYIYTVVLLGDLSLFSFLLITLLAGCYFVVCLSITLMYSTFFKNQLAAGALALVTLIGMALISNIPQLSPYMPSALMSWAQRLAAGSSGSSWSALIVSCSIVVAAIIIGWQVLNRKEL